MKLTPFVASALLLVLPALVSTAPTSSPADLASINPLQLFTRQATCAAPRPPTTGDKTTDDAALKKYNDLNDKMAAATKEAHAGEKACPATENTAFDKSKDKTKRTQIKNKCVAGFQKCVTQRKKASGYCTANGGTVDQGHKQAIVVCQNNLTKWQGKNP